MMAAKASLERAEAELDIACRQRPRQQQLLQLLELRGRQSRFGAGRPAASRPAAPACCQVWCQRLALLGFTPSRRATSACDTPAAKSCAASSRRRSRAAGSRRLLRLVAMCHCYHMGGKYTSLNARMSVGEHPAERSSKFPWRVNQAA
jgi:hypothetical protein